MNLADLLAITIAGTVAIIVPGPDFLIVTRNSVLYSKRAGVFTALGIFAGILWWVTASVAGLTLIISKMAVVFNVIKWVGACYLIYIGWRAIRGAKSAPAPDQAAPAPPKSGRPLSAWGAFRIGLFTNALNPKAAVFFLSLFSQIIRPETPNSVRFGYGLELSLIALTWFCLVATFFSTDAVKRFFDRISVWFSRVTGAIFIAFGLKLALSRR